MPDPCLAPSPRIALNLVGPTRALSADIIPSALFGNGIANEADGLYSPGLTQLLGGPNATFPTNANLPDQTVVSFRVAQGTRWTFQYYAASSNTAKWEFIGGAPVVVTVETAGHITPSGTGAWQDLSGSDVAGPNFQLPLTGVYTVAFGARLNAAQDGARCDCGLSIANNTPSDNNVASNGNTYSVSPARSVNISASAGNWLRMWYRDFGNTGTDTIDNRWMAITPVRCQ